MSQARYDLAQICLNGHVVNSTARLLPQHNEDRCSQCGTKTITKCPSCSSDIRGEYIHPDYPPTNFDFKAPSYCIACGEPYPWTSERIQAAIKLADELDGLTNTQKEQLKATIPELIKNGPSVVLAETRFKKLITKTGETGFQLMKAVLIDIVSETIRKTVFGA